MKKLANKVAVVTGAASGIGAAIAKVFAQEGAKVVVADMNMDGAKKVVDEIESNKGVAIAMQIDVAKETDVVRLIDTAVNTYGTLDILINNAGIMDNFVTAAELTDEYWDKIMAVNTTSVMRTTRKALSVFLPKEQGVIINIASIGGLFGSRAGAAYTASKHAVVGFTKNVGFQYAQKGIRCNAIAPGGVETNIGATIDNPDAFGMERAMAGMGVNPRMGKPEELAKLALFLASEDASFVNGTVVTADGGWTAY